MAIRKFICCSISLAGGIALGREGPSVQLGAGIASVLGRRFQLSTETVKALSPVGCSAALAAAFNTPIAAVLFSMEEVLGDLHAPGLRCDRLHHFLDGASSDPGRRSSFPRNRGWLWLSIRTPLTSVIMIFELTRDYSSIVPLMIANMISSFISQRFQHEPIYAAIAAQDGIVLPSGEAREHFAKRNVGAFMHGESQRLSSEPANYVHTDHSLSLALERMGEAGLEVIPVLSRAGLQKQLGMLTLTDVLRGYGVSRPAATLDPQV